MKQTSSEKTYYKRAKVPLIYMTRHILCAEVCVVFEKVLDMKNMNDCFSSSGDMGVIGVFNKT